MNIYVFALRTIFFFNYLTFTIYVFQHFLESDFRKKTKKLAKVLPHIPSR